MATYKVNLSETQFEAVPPGPYLVTLDKYEERISKGAKTAGLKMLNWEFIIKEPSKFSGKHLWLTTLVEGEPEYFIGVQNLMKATNLYTKEKLLSKSATIEPDKYVGLDFVAKVIHKDSGDPEDPYVNIKSLAPADTWTGGSSDSDW